MKSGIANSLKKKKTKNRRRFDRTYLVGSIMDEMEFTKRKKVERNTQEKKNTKKLYNLLISIHLYSISNSFLFILFCHYF